MLDNLNDIQSKNQYFFSCHQGMTFRVVTELSVPYITKLDAIPGMNGLFEMEGMFAEVFFELQVTFESLSCLLVCTCYLSHRNS